MKISTYQCRLCKCTYSQKQAMLDCRCTNYQEYSFLKLFLAAKIPDIIFYLPCNLKLFTRKIKSFFCRHDFLKNPDNYNYCHKCNIVFKKHFKYEMKR